MDDGELLDRARALTANRQVRRDTGRAVAERCRSLEPGETFIVPLPDGQPARRDTHAAVNAAAHKVLGAGGYRIASAPAGAMVTRVGPVRQPPGA